MLLAQMIACHSAAMECYRRTMLPEQSFEVWQVQVGAAGKLSRTYAALLEALGRHRGKGQQVVRVEHVTVQAGGRVRQPRPRDALARAAPALCSRSSSRR